MKLRDQLPQRISSPLANVRSHVARRTGANDPIRERRKRREAERQPRLEPGLPGEIVDLVGHTHTVTPSITIASDTASVTSGSTVTKTVACGAGKVLTGGGTDCGGTTSSAYVEGSWPSSSTVWTGRCHNPGPSTITMTVYVVCLASPITTST